VHARPLLFLLPFLKRKGRQKNLHLLFKKEAKYALLKEKETKELTSSFSKKEAKPYFSF